MVIYHKLFAVLVKNSGFTPFSQQGGVHTIADTNRLFCKRNQEQDKQRV